MKLHNTLIDKLLKLYEINSGWKEEWKLRQALEKLNVTIYKQQTGQEVLVDADQLEKEISGEK